MTSKTIPGKEIILSYDFPSFIENNACVAHDMKHTVSTVTMKLFVDMGVGIGGDVWPAAELFCKMVTSPVTFAYFRSLFDGRRILELGSGNGLVGILLEMVFRPEKIVITDIAEHVNLIDHNINLNNMKICKAESLDWLDIPHMTDDTFDVILALECVYKEELFIPLINTLSKKCNSSGDKPTIIILGMTRAFISIKFFTLLTEAGFTYKKVPEVNVYNTILPQDRQKLNISDIGMFFIEKQNTTIRKLT